MITGLIIGGIAAAAAPWWEDDDYDGYGPGYDAPPPGVYAPAGLMRSGLDTACLIRRADPISVMTVFDMTAGDRRETCRIGSERRLRR